MLNINAQLQFNVKHQGPRSNLMLNIKAYFQFNVKHEDSILI